MLSTARPTEHLSTFNLSHCKTNGSTSTCAVVFPNVPVEHFTENIIPPKMTEKEKKRRLNERWLMYKQTEQYRLIAVLLLFYSLMLVINSLNAFCPFSFLLNTPASSSTSRNAFPISSSIIDFALSLLKSG